MPSSRTASRSATSSATEASSRRAGAGVEGQPLDHAVALAVVAGDDGQRADEPLRHPVFAARDDGRRRPAVVRPELLVADVLDRGVGGGGDRRRSAHLDDLGAALGHARDEHLIEPRRRGLSAAQALREGVEHRHHRRTVACETSGNCVAEWLPQIATPAISSGRDAEGLGELADRPVVVEPGERREAVGGNIASGCRGDERVGVGGVSHHDHPHVVGGRRADRGALRSEDAGVRREQVGALHAGTARPRPDEQRDAAAVERDERIVADLDVMEQGERAVLQLERGALGGAHPLRDLEKPQADGTIRAEHVAGRDAEQQRVADLPAGAGDRDSRRLCHHALSLLPCQGSSPERGARGTVSA